jgi:ketosteroid isomerase-like protein
VVVGTEAIREALRAFLAAKPTIAMKIKILAQTGDMALMACQWEMTGTGPGGAPLKIGGQSAEVARRQPDGTWLFVIDNPWGLE